MYLHVHVLYIHCTYNPKWWFGNLNSYITISTCTCIYSTNTNFYYIIS